MGNQNEAQATRRCPALPAEKQTRPYEPPRAEPGHEGQPPRFVKRKEHPWMDGKREATDSDFNVNHSRVCFLFTNKRIEQRQFLAAERLATDYEKSQVMPRASTILVGNGASGGIGGGPQQCKIDADGRYENAIKSMGRGADIVALVVIANMTVGKAGANIGIKSEQRAMGRFDLALHDLADHYKL